MAPSILGSISDARLFRPSGVAKHPTAPIVYVLAQSNISPNGRTGDLSIVDVSNPASPFIVSNLTGFTNGGYLEIIGSRMYMIHDAGAGFPPTHFLCYDITNPTSLTLLGSLNDPWNTSGGILEVISETRVLVTHGTPSFGPGVIRFMNCDNPAAMTTAYTLTFESSPVYYSGPVVVRGNTMFVINGTAPGSQPRSRTLRSYDITGVWTGTAPTLLGSYSIPDDNSNLTGVSELLDDGRYIYIGGITGGTGYRMAVIDAANPAVMTHVTYTTASLTDGIGDNGWGLKWLDAGKTKIGFANGSTSIWSVSNPAVPTRIANLYRQDPLWGQWGRDWQNEFAYIGNGAQQFGSQDNRLIIVDMDVDFPVPATAVPSVIVTASYVNSAPPASPVLVSVSPDPLTHKQTLTLTGTLLNNALSVIVDGIGREFTPVNPTTIEVELPLMTVGPKTVHVEYV